MLRCKSLFPSATNVHKVLAFIVPSDIKTFLIRASIEILSIYIHAYADGNCEDEYRVINDTANPKQMKNTKTNCTNFCSIVKINCTAEDDKLVNLNFKCPRRRLMDTVERFFSFSDGNFNFVSIMR